MGTPFVPHESKGGVLSTAEQANWASERSGLQRLTSRNAMLAEAITQPRAYYNRRGAALKLISDTQDANFKTRYAALLKQSLPEATARSMASAFADKIAEYELAELEIELPENMSQFAVAQGLKVATAKLPGDMLSGGPAKRAPRKKLTKK